MKYALGIDIGTTFSAAAVAYEDGRVELVNLGGRAASIPSVVLVRSDGEILVGDAAEGRAAADPTRVAREFKRRLGDPTPLVLGGVPYSAAALTTILLRHVVDAVTRLIGDPPAAVAVCHPASYSSYRLELLANAAIEAGIANPLLIPEPVAAALQYATSRGIHDGEVVAVYDFGGGTFDIALLRATSSGFEIAGAPSGVDRLGGVDFDHALLQHINDELDGALDEGDTTSLSALSKIRRDVREAKEQLSHDSEVVISIQTGGLNETVTVDRSSFESLIAPRLGETFGALRRAVDSAGIVVGDINRVLVVGGSSRIPLVQNEVRLYTGRPIAENVDPEYAVALGAAHAAFAAVSGREGVAHVDSRSRSPETTKQRRATGRLRKFAVAVAVATAAAVATVMIVRSNNGGPRAEQPTPTSSIPAAAAATVLASTSALPSSVENSAPTAGVSTTDGPIVESTTPPTTTSSESTTATVTVETTTPAALPAGAIAVQPSKWGQISHLVPSPDGTTIAATGDEGGVVTLWDPESGQLERSLDAATESIVTDISFAEHGGRVLATSYFDNLGTLFSGAGTDLFELSAIIDTALNADGSLVATAGIDGRVTVFDAVDGGVVFRTDDPYEGLASISWAVGESLVVGHTFFGEVVVLAAGDGELVRREDLQLVAGAPEVSPDGTKLAGFVEQNPFLYDIAGGTTVTLDGAESEITDVGFSGDGRLVYAASADGAVNIWDSSTGERVATIQTGRTIAAATLNGDGTRLATANNAGEVRIWDPMTGGALRTLRGHVSVVFDLAFAGSDRLISCGGDDQLIFWDTSSSGGA